MTQTTKSSAPTRRRRLARRLERPMSPRGATARLIGTAALVAVALTCLALAQAWRAPITARVATAAQLEADAGRMIAEVFSAEAATWQADREHARSLVTGSLASSAATGLSAPAPAGVRAVRWEPVSVGVTAAQEDSGTALVVANVVVTHEDREPDADTKTVTADFVREDGRWLLSTLDELQ
ncbi:hypothetical protein [Gordonia caeni]|uniref:Mce-associated membrane protein n=1 Tax=Gordonia caeni TaxID=1007097 RepID=A0ABP7NR87_9ACTN